MSVILDCIELKKLQLFIKYEIKDFYPPISEKELFEALKFSKGFLGIPPEQVKIILHCGKYVVFQNGEARLKNRKSVPLMSCRVRSTVLSLRINGFVYFKEDQRNSPHRKPWRL